MYLECGDDVSCIFQGGVEGRVGYGEVLRTLQELDKLYRRIVLIFDCTWF